MDGQTIPQQNISMSGMPGTGEIDIYTYFTASPYFAFQDYDGSERKLFLATFRDLPPAVREYISSDQTASVIYTVGQTSDLEDNQIYELAKLIRTLLLGGIFIKDFPMTISSKLGIDDVKAGEIANKIISQSFGPIIEDIKRIQRNKFPDKIAQIQKGSQQATLNQPTARPDTPRPQQPSSQQGTPSVPPPLTPPPLRPPPTSPPPLRPAPTPPQTSVPQQPPLQQPSPRLQFKVPDLSGMAPSGKSNESLEKELEKVANIIDLRNKPTE